MSFLFEPLAGNSNTETVKFSNGGQETDLGMVMNDKGKWWAIKITSPDTYEPIPFDNKQSAANHLAILAGLKSNNQ
jgi:hypothetical protein